LFNSTVKDVKENVRIKQQSRIKTEVHSSIKHEMFKMYVYKYCKDQQ